FVCLRVHYPYVEELVVVSATAALAQRLVEGIPDWHSDFGHSPYLDALEPEPALDIARDAFWEGRGQDACNRVRGVLRTLGLGVDHLQHGAVCKPDGRLMLDHALQPPLGLK